MSTIGWVLIIAAIFVIRAAAKGRALNLKDDISDGFLALVTVDPDALGEVLSRSGDGLTADQADLTAYRDAGIAVAETATGIASSFSISSAAIKRGKAAKGYKWTRTGPDYYDCSGLMWRACQDVGAYNGPRFVTANVASLKAFKRVTEPAVNDLVVWIGHHMGVVTGPDQFYSARSIKSGIGYAAIKGFRKDAPIYLRAVGTKKIVKEGPPLP
jgi:cell wall-associated NlpC family hydrolase